MSFMTEVDLAQSGLYVRETKLDFLPDDTPEFCAAISRFTRGLAGMALTSLMIRFDEGRVVPIDPVEESAADAMVVANVPTLELHVPEPQVGTTLYNYHPQIPYGRLGWNSWWEMHPGAVSVGDGFEKYLQGPAEALCEGLPVNPAILRDIVGAAFVEREASGARGLPIRTLRLGWEIEVITNRAISDVMWKLGLLDGPQPMAKTALSETAV